jgi:hypothetical protein
MPTFHELNWSAKQGLGMWSKSIQANGVEERNFDFMEWWVNIQDKQNES